MKSPLRYPGGKSRAVDKIFNLIPPFDEFREPFVGGGSVFLHVQKHFPQKRYWINDLYPDLFLFWKQTQKNSNAVVTQVKKWKNDFPVGKELHVFLRKNTEQFSPIERAAAFFVFNRITFSGTTHSGGYSERAFLERFTESSVKRLAALTTALRSVEITNDDYQEVVNQPGENVLLFLDPPYYSATKSALYGKKGDLHKSFDHERLAIALKNCPHNWLVTYDDSDYVRHLYEFANIFSWDLTYGMRNVTPTSDQIGKEIFVSNYLNSLDAHSQKRLF